MRYLYGRKQRICPMTRSLTCDLCGAVKHEFLMTSCPECYAIQCPDCMCDCRQQAIDDAINDDNDE